MIFKYLDWDSEFFGLHIGKLVLDHKNDAICLCNTAIYKDYDLIYIFAQPNMMVNLSGCLLADEKVIYTKHINVNFDHVSAVKPYVAHIPNEALYHLALQSGVYSRYNLDRHFPEGSYEKLYSKWIEQSVNKAIANDVLCYYDNNKIVGMLTIAIEKDEGNIGLIAVDSSYRNKNIGTQLIMATECYLQQKNILTLNVATQKKNEAACHLYKKNGFCQLSITNVYHWWPKIK